MSRKQDMSRMSYRERRSGRDKQSYGYTSRHAFARMISARRRRKGVMLFPGEVDHILDILERNSDVHDIESYMNDAITKALHNGYCTECFTNTHLEESSLCEKCEEEEKATAREFMDE